MASRELLSLKVLSLALPGARQKAAPSPFSLRLVILLIYPFFNNRSAFYTPEKSHSADRAARLVFFYPSPSAHQRTILFFFFFECLVDHLE